MKMMARTTRPSTEGKAPGSPVRSRETQLRMASGMERSSTSREKPPDWSDRGRSPALLTAVSSVSDIASLLGALVGGGGGETDVAAATGRDQLDDLGRAALGLLDLGGHAAEVQGDDPVGD